MMTKESLHISVMTQEVLENLNLKTGQCIVDCTVGLGGHAFGIAEKIGREGCLIAIDRDEESLKVAQERLSDFTSFCRFIREDFRNIDSILESEGIKEVDGFLMDLGISSYQLEDPERGFSFKVDGPLDMRMDKNSYISAADLINSLSQREITMILRNFGEERWHSRIARYLAREREKKPFASTFDLSHAVLKAIPRRFQNQKIHPATRTFQAFRIAVNRELEALEIGLEKCVPNLRKNGRICVIAFHSLEDRIVKEKLRNFARQGILKLIMKKPLRPSASEIEMNPRSRSARLRIAERI